MAIMNVFMMNERRQKWSRRARDGYLRALLSVENKARGISTHQGIDEAFG